MIALALTIIAAYLVGSIPFGLILTRAAGLGDIRQIGSGNIGATNVLRTGNKGLAAATLALDLGKGLVVVLLARADLAGIAAVAVVAGHIFPPWLRFNGGKGVATAAGAILAYVPPVGLAAGATWLVVAAVTRYSSLAAIIATCAAPLYAWAFTRAPGPTVTILVIALLVLWRHWGNMVRLVHGEESRIGAGKGG
ncbi:MAG TPA: glycerol-3-phosphate 1-O-acyltransferase PlsY [Stellaceae bacterium]|nr:glycerol-3-phosphate 1-O-acyltransferase PlsY [Stellaceae bacterium]